MSKKDPAVDAILASLKSPDGQDMFADCPVRSCLPDLSALDATSVKHVLAHMLGHLIDYQSGEQCCNEDGELTVRINQDGLEDELRYVYNDWHNPNLNEERRVNPDLDPGSNPEYQGFGPEQIGCFASAARAELMAEAIRVYLVNPNYLKSAAPNLAARIRAAVNERPGLGNIIQFN